MSLQDVRLFPFETLCELRRSSFNLKAHLLLFPLLLLQLDPLSLLIPLLLLAFLLSLPLLTLLHVEQDDVKVHVAVVEDLFHLHFRFRLSLGFFLNFQR